jgi:hypothetical protein
MLAAHQRRQPRLRELFRNHYRFDTSVGPKTWRELGKLARSATVAGTRHERLLFVLSESGANLHAQPMAARKGFVVVHAMNGDRDVLEDFGRTDDVEIADIGLLMEDPEDGVPEAFRALAVRLAPDLHRHHIHAVTFFKLPGESLRPTELQVASVPPEYRPTNEHWLQADSLMLNVAHPVIEVLAGVAHKLTAEALASIADGLFAIAALHSPLQESHRRVTGIVVQQLLDALSHMLGSKTSSTTAINEARCFVALPYRVEFDPVWTTVRSVLEAPPYHWKVVRADSEIHEPSLLDGVLQHIAGSRRFIADVSGESASVLLELGMMLQKDNQSTLVLADEQTFSRLPTDMKGTICMVYRAELRSDPVAFRAWFAHEILARTHFIAMAGGWARHEEGDGRAVDHGARS